LKLSLKGKKDRRTLEDPFKLNRTKPLSTRWWILKRSEKTRARLWHQGKKVNVQLARSITKRAAGTLAQFLKAEKTAPQGGGAPQKRERSGGMVDEGAGKEAWTSEETIGEGARKC